MPSARSVRRTPRGGKGGILSPLRSASPLRRPAKTPSSFSRLDDTGEPSPASAVAAPAVSGASDSARAAATMTPSAQPSATSAAAPASASALALTTPYSGRPDPRRTLTPVDLDETPPPETPSNASATAGATAGAGGFTPTTTFDSFGFPTDEKAAASASGAGAGAGAGAASGGPTAVGAIGTNNTNASDPFVSPSAASFANNHNGNGNSNNSNNSTPRRGSQQNITNDPFLDLTVDDDGFVVTSGFGQAHGNGRTTNTTATASAAATPAAKSPAPSTAAAAAAGRPPAYRSPLPPKPNDTANATPNASANANASLLSSAKKKKSLQNHFNNKATSAHNTPNSQSQSVHRMSSNNSVAGNSVASASSKHIGQLAVDSNCIAGEFREIVVTLSEASTIDDDDDNDDNGQDGEGRNKHNDASRESYGSREMKRVAQSGTTGMTAEDIAFGLDPRDISQLDDDDDDDEYGPNGNGQYHQNGGQMFPDEAAAAAAAANARDGQNGTTATTTNNNNDDYGPTDRTPPRHPHGPRDGAEHMVVLSESQKKLRDKLLRGSGGSGKGVHAKRPSAGTPGTRLDEHFASPTASGIPRPHDRSVMGMGMGMGMGSSQSVGGVPRSISTNNLNGVGSGEDGDAANTSPSSMISGVTNFTEGGFPSSAANPSLPSHVYRADGEELPQSAAQYRGTWMLPNGQNQGLGGQGFLPGSGVGPDYTMSYLDKPSGIDGTPASVIADRRMAAAMRAAGTAPLPPPSAASSGNSVHSAPGAGRSRGGSSSSHPAQPDDEVMRSVANRVKASMRLGPASPPPPSHPGLPRPRSVSPKPAAPSVQLRHREYADGSPRAASSAGGAANGSSIVFGAPDTFEAADSLPSIRDRAKALNDWMGGKGVKIEKEVRPTAGYTNDEMYQNAYLRRTSPQVVGSRKTIGDARASLTPPKTRPAPNSGTFAHGSSSSSSSAKKSSSNGAGGSATKSRNAPAFLAKFQGNGNDALPSSPEGDAFNVADAGGSAAKSENAPAFLSKFQGNAFPEEADRELPPISVGEVAASASDQGKSPSTQASPASLKENAMPPISTSAKKAAPLTSHKSMFQQQSNAKSIGTDNNDDDMMFLRSWGKSRGKQSTVETPTSTSPSEDTFPGSPKFDDDGFGDIVSMNGKVPAAGDAWGVENAHDDDAWANSDADFGEPFYS